MNLEKQTFITEYLRHSSEYTAYCLAYNPENAADYNAIMSAAARLMDDPEVGGVIRSVIDGIRQDVVQEIRAQQKTELLTVQSKRELLARIARGEMTAVQHYKGKDCNHCTQMVLPTINQMLKAIDLDNRMAGHYPIDKRHLPEPSGQVPVNNEMGHGEKEDNNLSRPFRGIGGNPQQLSEAVSLQPLRKPSISQQNITNGQSSLPGRGLVEASSQILEKTENLQQNATKLINSFPPYEGGGELRTANSC